MNNIDELVTDSDIHLSDVKAFMEHRQGNEQYLGRYFVQSTSGTTGQPGLFIMDNDEWFIVLASSLRNFKDTDININSTHRPKVVQITSTNASHMSSQGATGFGNMGMPVVQLSATEPLKTLVEKLNQSQPDLILAYASIIRVLAGEQLAGHLRIAPNTIISGSEVLTKDTRHRAVQAWGETLFNMYGTTDCGGIGAECNQHMGMHLQEDLVIVENVDRNNNPVAAGEYGEKLLVTVLWKYAQPLIRYELSGGLTPVFWTYKARIS